MTSMDVIPFLPRWIMLITPSVAASALTAALLIAVAVLATPRSRWARAATSTGLGLLLGSALAITSLGLGSYSPQEFTVHDVARLGGEAAIALGALCAVGAMVRSLHRPGRGGQILGPAAGLLIGLSAPRDFRISMRFAAWSPLQWPWGVQSALQVVGGTVFLAALAVACVVVGARFRAIAVGLTAGALFSAALTAVLSALSFDTRLAQFRGDFSGFFRHISPGETFLGCAIIVVLGTLAGAIMLRSGQGRDVEARRGEA